MVKNKIYTGIGSRETPPEVLNLMVRIGATLGQYGWTLRSGHAPGADQAFEWGAMHTQGKREIFLPWDGFEGAYHDGVNYFVIEPGDILLKARQIAEQFHPNWKACSPGARNMHTRNVFQVGGPNLDLPSDLVICWTKNGKQGGGTGQALRIAKHEDIPIFDLAIHTEGQILNYINHGVRSE